MCARFVNFFSTTSCTNMYFSITCVILPSPLLDAHLGCPCFCRLTVDMIHENHFMSQFLQEVFRHHSFGNSSRRGVHFCFSRTQANCLLCSWPCCECCVSPLHNSAACVACPIAVCVHVHELWRCNSFDQALCTWNAFQISHNTLLVHLVTLGRTSYCSCCLLHACT